MEGRWAFLVAQMVQNLPAMQKTPGSIPGLGRLLEKGMATHYSILAWRIPWTEEPGGLQPMRTQKAGHNPATFTFFFFFFLRMNKVYFQGKFGLGIQNEAGQRLIEFCQENSLIIVNTLFQQHKRRLYTWTSPDGQHRNQIDYKGQKWYGPNRSRRH